MVRRKNSRRAKDRKKVGGKSEVQVEHIFCVENPKRRLKGKQEYVEVCHVEEENFFHEIYSLSIFPKPNSYSAKTSNVTLL